MVSHLRTSKDDEIGHRASQSQPAQQPCHIASGRKPVVARETHGDPGPEEEASLNNVRKLIPEANMMAALKLRYRDELLPNLPIL